MTLSTFGSDLSGQDPLGMHNPNDTPTISALRKTYRAAKYEEAQLETRHDAMIECPEKQTAWVDWFMSTLDVINAREALRSALTSTTPEEIDLAHDQQQAAEMRQGVG